MEHKALAFEMENEKQSEEIQLKLFELGYEWATSGMKVDYLDKEYLYTKENGKIMYGDEKGYFEQRIKTNVCQLCTLEGLNNLYCNNHEWVDIEACGVVNQYCRKCKTMKEE